MDETEVTEQLDRDGLLEASHGPGVYALKLRVPDLPERAWQEQYDVPPPDALFERLEAAKRFLYVGASSDVYGRLCDHAGGVKRRAGIMRVCPPVRVVDVEGCESPFEREYGFGLGLSDGRSVVWVDGEVI